MCNVVTNSFIAYFPYCEQIKRSFWDHLAVCVSVWFSVYITAGCTTEKTQLPTGGHVIFYAVYVVSKESRQLVLPRTSVRCERGGVLLFSMFLVGEPFELQHSQMNPVHNTPLYFSKIQLNVALPPVYISLGLPSVLFPTKTLYTFLFSLMHATCCLILLGLLILTIFGNE
jgi:hypothetical protein